MRCTLYYCVIFWVYFLSVVDCKNAFVTFYYDYGPDSKDFLLATRVLMKSVQLSNTKYKRIVLFPKDGASQETRDILHKDGIETFVSKKMENVFRYSSHTDNYAQLMHTRNKLMLWDDPELKKLHRIAYLDPENVVMKNMDEIFECSDLCGVDNGQAVVYSNSLLIVNPASRRTREIYSKAIDSFLVKGKEYDYTGIAQGFVPGIFEAFEKSPFFNQSQPNLPNSSPVKRLPFYYSINHMVYYERLNWELYQCNHKSKEGIPGPLLSYKYGGKTVKPWLWFPYIYFNIFWYWHNMRLELNDENHLSFFCTYTLLYSLSFATLFYLYFRFYVSGLNQLILQLPKHRLKLMAISLITVLTLWAISLWIIPSLMHPGYAAALWIIFQNLALGTLILAIRATSKRREFRVMVHEGLQSMALIVCAHIAFVKSSNSIYYTNPVQKPVVLVLEAFFLIILQVYTLYNCLRSRQPFVS